MNLLYIVPFAFNFIEWIRDNVLQPFIEILADVIVKLLKIQFQLMIASIMNYVYKVAYFLYVAVLKIVDALQTVFNSLSGAEKINYKINGEIGQDYLTGILLRIPQIKTVFWSIWLISIVLCVVFLIAAVIRSISHLDDTGQPVGDILRQTASTLLLFVTIQIIAFCTLNLANLVTSSAQNAVNYAMDSAEDIRISNALFAATALRAKRTGDATKDVYGLNVIMGAINTVKGQDTEYTVDWDAVKDFYSGKYKYYDIVQVNKQLVTWKIDYFSAIICVLCILKFMAGAAIAFVQRVLSLIVSYVTAPFFVSLAPLDGGARFERWKDFFIGNCFSAIGVLFSLKIYLMILPIFLKTDLIEVKGNGPLNYLIRIYCVIILSLGFEKLGDIVNRIISDAGIMGPSEAFSIVSNFYNKVTSGVNSAARMMGKGSANGNKGGGNGGGSGK